MLDINARIGTLRNFQTFYLLLSHPYLPLLIKAVKEKKKKKRAALFFPVLGVHMVGIKTFILCL